MYFSLYGYEGAYLDQQGIYYQHDIDLWANIMALAGFALFFMTIAYIQLRRVPKLK